MFPGVDEGLKEFLFQAAPEKNCAWFGDVFSLAENAQELVSVRFGTQDFLVGFTSPLYEAGNVPELLAEFAASQADGLGRMLVQAKVLHEQGKLRKVTAPTSRVRSKAEPLRVQAVEA